MTLEREYGLRKHNIEIGCMRGSLLSELDLKSTDELVAEECFHIRDSVPSTAFLSKHCTFVHNCPSPIESYNLGIELLILGQWVLNSGSGSS